MTVITIALIALLISGAAAVGALYWMVGITIALAERKNESDRNGHSA